MNHSVNMAVDMQLNEKKFHLVNYKQLLTKKDISVLHAAAE